MNVDALSPDELIDLLGLQPHPEGGWYAETFRDAHEIDEGDGPRAASTAIYFMLTEGQVSHWHRVDAVEIWHWHAGAPLELSIAATEADAPIVLTLGNDLAIGFRPQGIVPRHHWQSAKSLGAWTLVGCTVAPGFRFEGFDLAEPGWMPG